MFIPFSQAPSMGAQPRLPRCSAADAANDIPVIDTVLDGKAAAGNVTAVVYFRQDDPADVLRMKLFVAGDFIALSECLPVFENLGLKVIAEAAFPLTPCDAS